MLFPYKYVPHQMEKMQEFIDFIFHKVWCKAPSTEYGIHLFEAEKDLYNLIDDLFKMDLAGRLKDSSSAKFFYEGVNDIYNEFKSLANNEIEEYQRHFEANNKLKESCTGSKDVTPMTYASLNPMKATLNRKLEEFFKNLYSSGFFSLKKSTDKIGATLKDYYHSFVRENDNGVCPFCGLLPIDGEFDPTREAFDHFLPKSKYPFNSVNLKNLAPSCHKCNSGNKRDQDPLHDQHGNRRKTFYPFDSLQPNIEISVSIREKSWIELSPEKLLVKIVSATYAEEVDTWKELFRVEQRYLAKCCNKNGGAGWLNRVFNEHQNYNLTWNEMLGAEIQSATRDPWNDANFLKKAFLEGCDRAGLFTQNGEGA